MRTTLSIDDQLLESLKAKAQSTGKPLKQVVNETLRLGLDQLDRPTARPYRLEPVSMGTQRAGIDLDKALQLADALEDVGIAQKLDHGQCLQTLSRPAACQSIDSSESVNNKIDSSNVHQYM